MISSDIPSGPCSLATPRPHTAFRAKWNGRQSTSRRDNRRPPRAQVSPLQWSTDHSCFERKHAEDILQFSSAAPASWERASRSTKSLVMSVPEFRASQGPSGEVLVCGLDLQTFGFVTDWLLPHALRLRWGGMPCIRIHATTEQNSIPLDLIAGTMRSARVATDQHVLYICSP